MSKIERSFVFSSSFCFFNIYNFLLEINYFEILLVKVKKFDFRGKNLNIPILRDGLEYLKVHVNIGNLYYKELGSILTKIRLTSLLIDDKLRGGRLIWSSFRITNWLPRAPTQTFFTQTSTHQTRRAASHMSMAST
jgi:hypothetical protein